MSKTKKVAFVATLYKHLADFSMPHMKILQSWGYEIHIYANEVRRRDDLVSAGFICHDTIFSRNPFRTDNIRAIQYLIKEFRHHRFSLIHCHTPMGSVVSRIAAKISGLKNILYTAHGFHFFKGAPLKYWLLYYSIEKLLAKWTDYLILVNKEDYARAKNNFSVRKDVLHVPEHTDIKKFSSTSVDKTFLRESLNLSDQDFVIIYIAEFIERKNQIQLIKAIEILDNPCIKCLFVGEGETLETLKLEVEQKKLSDFIKFLGYRKDIPQLLQIADISALLSYHEGLPVCILESLAASKPILATNIRGSQDLVDTQKNGFLVEPDDKIATADAIKWLFENKNQLPSMGGDSFSKVQQYDVIYVENVMKELYSKILNTV